MAIQTATFSGLVPEGEYIMFAVLDEAAEIIGRVIVQNANAMANNAVLEIKDGTFKTNAYKTDVLYVGGSNGATINMQPVVEGGKFEGSISSTVKAPFITGGTYAEDVSELCKAEYLCKENTADGTFGVSIDPIYVYVKYYGRSIRYATDNGPEPTNCVDLRVSYNLGEEVIKWGWTYRLGNSEEMNLDGVYRSATNFSNIVFSNVAFVNLEKNISVKLWVVVEIDGVETRLEETNFHVFTTYDVLDIMATEYPEDPAGVYSQSVLAEYQAYKSNQEIAMLNDEEND